MFNLFKKQSSTETLENVPAGATSPGKDESETGEPTDKDLREQVVAAIKTVFDPEIPVNVYDLGLIYSLDISPKGEATIAMTLTAPACPVAGTLPKVVEQAVKNVSGISDAKVELVWDPPWTQDRMSEEALLQLGML